MSTSQTPLGSFIIQASTNNLNEGERKGRKQSTASLQAMKETAKPNRTDRSKERKWKQLRQADIGTRGQLSKERYLEREVEVKEPMNLRE